MSKTLTITITVPVRGNSRLHEDVVRAQTSIAVKQLMDTLDERFDRERAVYSVAYSYDQWTIGPRHVAPRRVVKRAKTK